MFKEGKLGGEISDPTTFFRDRDVNSRAPASQLPTSLRLPPPNHILAPFSTARLTTELQIWYRKVPHPTRRMLTLSRRPRTRQASRPCSMYVYIGSYLQQSANGCRRQSGRLRRLYRKVWVAIFGIGNTANGDTARECADTSQSFRFNRPYPY